MDKNIYDNKGDYIGHISDGPQSVNPDSFLQFIGYMVIAFIVLGILAVGAVYVILWILGHMM